MTPDAMIYEGLLHTCDQSINLVLIGTIEKRNENGNVIESERDIVMLRGDQVCFIALNDRYASHFATSDAHG
jgi:small nuclear ribonucleoprotein (snRNP)-like protein